MTGSGPRLGAAQPLQPCGRQGARYQLRFAVLHPVAESGRAWQSMAATGTGAPPDAATRLSELPPLASNLLLQRQLPLAQALLFQGYRRAVAPQLSQLRLHALHGLGGGWGLGGRWMRAAWGGYMLDAARDRCVLAPAKGRHCNMKT